MAGDNKRRRGPSERTSLAEGGPQIFFQACKLIRIDGPGQGEEHAIDSSSTVIGSAADCDIQVVHKTVSRRHFTIERDQQTYRLRDQGSTNGTFIDDLRVQEAFLRPGALIKAGDVFFRFELAYTAADVAPAASREFGPLLGDSVRLRQIFAVLEQVAPTETTILIQGETGTGKGAVARAIHQASPRADAPFVVFDCGSIAPNLLESELFGHERGAFTGAIKQRAGALEEAGGGTLFIDELSDLSLVLQPKLLRALEDREFCRVGSNKPMQLDCRVVAASQRDLWNEVLAERFRRDLYFRLAVVTIPLPSLAERRGDIPMLVDRFLSQLGTERYASYADLSQELKSRLDSHDWPGNIRELRNIIERLSVMGERGLTWGSEPPAPVQESGSVAPTGERAFDITFNVTIDRPYRDVKEDLISILEREYVKRLLDACNNNVTAAARQAGLGRRHFYTLMDKHGIGGGGSEEE